MAATPDLRASLDADLEAVVARARASLVRVANGRGTGSGTVWHSEGLVVTNAHVLGRGGVRVTLAGGEERPARVLAADPRLDLAALAVEASGLAVVELGDSRALRAGELVFAVGYPWGVPGAVTAGMLIGAGAGLPELADDGQEWLAMSLRVRPGHSGGPLVDARGRLVGVNTRMHGPEVGVAVPVHVIKRFLKSLVV